MKTINIILATSALALFASCTSDSENLFENKLFINTQDPTYEILFKPASATITEEKTLTIGVALKAEDNITAEFMPNEQLLGAYQQAYYQPDAIAFPIDKVEVINAEVEILKGAVVSTPATVKFSNIQELNRDSLYVLPIQLANVKGIDVLDSKTVVYYVFKGAALINVVADIRDNRFPVSWNNDVTSLSKITVEALIRVRDFGNLGGIKNNMSTIFGDEGNWLVRIGDAGFPQNQIQLVNPGGNFPAGNEELGLPTNTWVHIAVVWDGTTGDRIIYHDGKIMAQDKGAQNTTVNLDQRDTWIGRAWDEQRWLDGEIAELRVWHAHRTQEEIVNNFYEVDPTSEGLIAYWKFNEGQGNLIKDYSVHANHVTAVNDLSWTKVSLPESAK